MTDYKTPGVYFAESNAFPNSVVAVATAVPVFIGYTEKAEHNGKSLSGIPARISSFAEYIENFGGGFKSRFTVVSPAASDIKEETFMLNGKSMIVNINKNNIAYFYNCIRLFYANGGVDCYIYSIGMYGDKKDGFEIRAADFIGSTEKPQSVFDILEKELEPTLVVLPDVIALGKEAYETIYTAALLHCGKVQNRIGVFDLRKQEPANTTDDIVEEFRNAIGNECLSYGAAYYPWLKTSIIQAEEIDFENLDASIDLSVLLPEQQAKGLVIKFKADNAFDDNSKKNYHQSLKACSPGYALILEEIRAKLNELPPACAMAGLFSLVDNSRGVWKAPANVSVSMVNAPSINISMEEQEKLNVDVMAGKSINVIRAFPGIGTLVWGARTLDGNSQDWRYINVRRTIIMIEQSVKLALHAYVFEPNDSSTWITIKSMIINFLTNLWKQGALAGAVPEQAFDVQAGLGSTMTANDIIEGIMNISVRVAIIRPAEFIIITFQQKQQQS